MSVLRQLLWRRAPAGPDQDETLDRPLLLFSEHDPWTVRDACEGTQIFGATGAGKTSGSGQAIAHAFLENGFGGLVLTAKPDDTALWQAYCAATGREDDLIIFSPENDKRFNFLDYELNRKGRGGGITENIVSLFTSVLEIEERNSSSREPYWENALKQLLRNAVDLLAISTRQISLAQLHDIVESAPSSIDELNSASWQDSSFCFRCVEMGDKREKTDSQRQDFELTAKYWFKEFPRLNERTRTCIVSMFTGMADGFLRGELRDLFCTETDVTPEDTHRGKVILLDLPEKQFDKLAHLAQALWKYIWQRTVEQRDVKEQPLPVFLWADEAHLFVTSHDQVFQTTARSSRACTVYLTQNLSNYLSELGPEGSARAKTDSLLGNLQTKIFHCNGDQVTNTWAAELFAKSWQFRASTSAQQSDPLAERDDPNRITISAGQSLDYDILPQEFTALRKGGPPNNNQVDAIIFQGGRTWNATGKNALRTSFKQEQLPED